MPKSGEQKDGFFWGPYRECVDFRTPKTEEEKKHTKFFKTYEFGEILEEMIDSSEICKKYEKYNPTTNELKKVIFGVFYKHLAFAKDVITGNNICTVNDFADKFLTAIVNQYNKSDKGEKDRPFNIEDTNERLDSYIEFGDSEKTPIIKKLKKMIYDLTDYENWREQQFILYIFGEKPKDKKWKIRERYSGVLSYMFNLRRVSVKSNNKGRDKYEYYPFHTVPEDKTLAIFGKNRLTENDYRFVYACYWNLLDKENENLFEMEGEDKFLEKMMLDSHFGCSLLGYLKLKEIPFNHIDLIMELKKYGELAITPLIQEVIDDVIDMYTYGYTEPHNDDEDEDDENDNNNEAEDENENEDDEDGKDDENSLDYDPTDFLDDILELSGDFGVEFVRYLYQLKTHDNRKQYLENLPDKCKDEFEISWRNQKEYWKYLLIKNVEPPQKNKKTKDKNDEEKYFELSDYKKISTAMSQFYSYACGYDEEYEIESIDIEGFPPFLLLPRDIANDEDKAEDNGNEKADERTNKEVENQ